MATTISRLRPSTCSSVLSILCIMGLAYEANGAQRSWRIDPARTSIAFTVDAIGWPQTKGRFREFDGKISINFDRPDASYVTFRVAAKSVDVGSPSFNDYLRTDAFFDVNRFQNITFESTRVEKIDNQHASVTGNLTLRGITHPLTIDVNVDNATEGASNRIGFRATGIIHRLEFDMKAGFPAISNDVVLVVTTEALAQ